MSVTEQEIILSKELNDIGEDIEGVRHVQDVYGTMPSGNYKIFCLVDRDSIDEAINQLTLLKDNLKPIDDGKNQVVMVVNNIDPNPVVYMANQMKDVVIDEFKESLPNLDNALEQTFIAKKTELEAL